MGCCSQWINPRSIEFKKNAYSQRISRTSKLRSILVYGTDKLDDLQIKYEYQVDPDLMLKQEDIEQSVI